jgi:hypothetical protein
MLSARLKGYGLSGAAGREAMHEQLMREVQDRMTENIRAMEPEAMLRTWLSASLKEFEQMQEIFKFRKAGTN